MPQEPMAALPEPAPVQLKPHPHDRDNAPHEALRNRGHALDIRVEAETTVAGSPATVFHETVGDRRFTLGGGPERAVSRVRHMLQCHPHSVWVDGFQLKHEALDAARPCLWLTGNIGRYPDRTVLSGGKGAPSCAIVVDGVAYQYRENNRGRRPSHLEFEYLTADPPDREHPNCHRVRLVTGRANLVASLVETSVCEAVMADWSSVRLPFAGKGSALEKQARAQREWAEAMLPPLAPDWLVHTLWEPWAKLQERNPDDEASDVRYYNRCVLEDEGGAVYLEGGDERHNAAAAYALWRNPGLGYTPVMRYRRWAQPFSGAAPSVPTRAVLVGARAVDHDGLEHDLMESHGDEPFVRPVRSLEFTVEVRAGDGPANTVQMAAPVFFAGHPGREQLWVARSCPLMPGRQEMARLIENAYWDEGWAMADCETLEERDERTEILADRCLRGEDEAFRGELNRLGAGFLPVSRPPAHKMVFEKRLSNRGTLTVTYEPPAA